MESLAPLSANYLRHLQFGTHGSDEHNITDVTATGCLEVKLEANHCDFSGGFDNSENGPGTLLPTIAKLRISVITSHWRKTLECPNCTATYPLLLTLPLDTKPMQSITFLKCRRDELRGGPIRGQNPSLSRSQGELPPSSVGEGRTLCLDLFLFQALNPTMVSDPSFTELKSCLGVSIPFFPTMPVAEGSGQWYPQSYFQAFT